MKAIIAILMLLFTSIFNPVYAKTQQPTSLEQFINMNCKVNCVDPETLATAISFASTAFDLSPLLLLSMIKVESRFNPQAKNRGSVGLMQILLGYHKAKFKDKDPYKPIDNVFIGAAILKDCFDRNDRLRSSPNRLSKKQRIYLHSDRTTGALKCYNGGGNSHYASLVLSTLATVKAITF
jgi:soluble lytic murein transglycosylase-like protein